MTVWMLWLASALAQEPPAVPPNAAALCADAAVGTEVEVCMALAARHPDQVDAVASALRSHIDRATSDDRELLDGLLMLLSADGAVAGATRLGDLGDPRAVLPLSQAVEQRELPVALAAVASLARYREGLEPLTRWVTDARLAIELRIAAAHALGQLGSEEGADALITALRRRGMPPPLREAMLTVVETHFPARVAELEHQVTRDGSWWLAIGAGEGLGYSLALGGRLGQADLAGLGAVTGFAAGGTAGYILGRAWPMEADDAAFVTTTGIVAGTAGVLIGAGVSRDADVAWVTGLGGHVAGFGSGYGLRKIHGGTVSDAIEGAAFSGATAMALGTGVTWIARQGRGGWDWEGAGLPDLPALATGIGMAGGLAAGHLIAPRIDLRGQDAWLVSLGTVYGTAFGTLVPVPGERLGLPATGFALGGLTGYLLSDRLDVPFGTIAAGTVGMTYGGFIGAGIGWLADPFPDDGGNVIRTAALVGGTAGLVLGTIAEENNPQPIDDKDVVFTAFVTGWASWQSAGWHRYLFPPPQIDGLFLMAPAVLGATTALASPLLDVPNSYSVAALSIGLWGAYLGGVTAELVDAGPDDILLATLVGSDAGLIVGGVLAAPPLSVPPVVIALADAGGVLGGSMFALGSSFFADDVDTILSASLVGSGVGFVGGAVLGVALNRSGRSRELAWLPPLPRVGGRWSVIPGAMARTEGVAWGASVRVTEW